MSVSVGMSPRSDEPLKKLSVNGQTQYEVKHNGKRCELHVGSLGLQLFRGGKPTESVLFKDMDGWHAVTADGDSSKGRASDEVTLVHSVALLSHLYAVI